MSFLCLTVASNKLFFIYFFRGGKYSEDDAKGVLVQILNVVAFCHLQGVVHRDLKPEVKHTFDIFPFLFNKRITNMLILDLPKNCKQRKGKELCRVFRCVWSKPYVGVQFQTELIKPKCIYDKQTNLK